NEGLDCLIEILKDIENEVNDKERKQHLKSLQNINQCNAIKKTTYCQRESLPLHLRFIKSMGFLRGKFEEEVNWKTVTLKNIMLLKDKIKKKETPAHEHILTVINNIDINKISNDDLLCIGVIDLSLEKYNILESNYESLVEEKANIRNLSKDVRVKKICNDFLSKRNEVHKLQKFVLLLRDIVTYDQWIEDDHIKKCVAISEESENILVEIIARLIDIVMYHLPVDYEVEVTRAERQSKASKNCKVQQKSRLRGDKPDLIFCVYLRQKWKEIIFFESGKWNADEDKINHDHNKLVQLCLDGSKELVKKYTKETFYRNYIRFSINIAVVKAKIPLNKELVEKIEEFVHALLVLRNGIIVNLQSIINSFQKRSRKTSDISPPSREAGRLSKKNSVNF
ncbi:7108_t:CDS:2, partial [Funneliformis mosseae]